MQKVSTFHGIKINNCGCSSFEIPLSPIATGGAFYVQCNKCSCRGGLGQTEYEAIDNWNRAHPELSRACRNLQLLEADKKILLSAFSQSNFCILSDTRDCIEAFDKNTKEQKEYFPLSVIFELDFESYEEPKYCQVDYTVMLNEFIDGKDIRIFDLDMDCEMSLSAIYQDGLLFEWGGESQKIVGEDFLEYKKRQDWRVYE